MWNTVLDAVGSAAFLPHGHCFLWTPALLWSYLIADTTIVISYYSIPLALVYFAIRRKDFGYRWLLWMFGAFIAACGTTHLLSIVTIWQPVYWLDAAVKGLTALVSLVTAIALWPAIPLLLRLPSPAQLRGLNQELEQKVAERQRAEQRFRRVVESSPYAMILVDAEGRIQMINTETELLFGYPRDTLLGQPLNRLIPERFHSSHDKLRLDFNRAPQTRPMGGGRALTGRRHDGAEFPVEIGLNAIDTEEGPATLATLVDITERKRIERALRDSEQRNRLVVDNAMDAIISMDMKGAITAWNARAETLFQWTAGDIIGHGVAKTLLPELAATALEELIAADGEQRSNRRVETVAQCRDGGRLPVEVSITPYELDGQRHFTAFVRDITERKKSDEEIQRHRDHLSELVDERTRDLQNAVDHAEKANRTKDDFLATMSHELRTPLNAILGLSESLLEQRVGALNERQLRAVTTIGSSGRHLLELINDILDLSKLSAGALVLEISAVAVKPLCDASLLFVKEAAAKKQIDLTASYDSAIGSIEADPRRLKQMLINLLTNAVKFTPSHGKIGLAVSGDRVNRTVNLTVWDTGIGMVKSDLGRLFKPFAQLDSALSRGFEGTGLGLALVMRMAEQHGGTVTVESEPGKGSRFTVVLPWIEAQTSGAAPDRRPRLAQTGDTGAMDERPKALPLILLAEDNETNILVIADYLEDKGYRVSLARNGVEALERTRSDRPDLILMDIQMPVMDGLEATRCLRLESNPDLARIPVVALTALAMPGDEQRCLAAGATEYLTKPVSFRDLLDAVKRLTETGA